jgi:hypothetical protein
MSGAARDADHSGPALRATMRAVRTCWDGRRFADQPPATVRNRPSHMFDQSASAIRRHGVPIALLPATTARSALAVATWRARRIHGADGRSWDVLEQVSVMPVHGQSHLSLVFMSPEMVRRVRTYPPNWYELSDLELETLSWRV